MRRVPRVRAGSVTEETKMFLFCSAVCAIAALSTIRIRPTFNVDGVSVVCAGIVMIINVLFYVL